jgi:polyribonucleotide 5'-hydroxyl-kinase
MRVGGVNLPSSAKTIQHSAHQDNCTLMRIEPTEDLVYCLVGVLHPGFNTSSSSSEATGKSGEISQQFLQSNIAGFIHIVQVSRGGDSMTILCPCPGQLPSNYLLVGDIKWVDDNPR